jgi:hypothetical protein
MRRAVPISVARWTPVSVPILASILAFGLVLGAAGCGKSTIREYESQACSTNDSDDPFLICSPAYDLVCINTYNVLVTNAKEAMKWDGGVRPVYVCRIACSTEQDCLQQGDVCCPGAIHGKTYNKTAGCVPRGMCEALRNVDAGTTPDAATPDAPAPDAPAGDAAPADARPDGGSDGSGPDSGSDGGPDSGAEVGPTG